MSWVFWSSLFLLAFTYVGYPLVIAVAARISARRFRVLSGVAPSVSVVVVVRNESRRIGPRIENLLACDFPGEREIIVVCGNCDDDTAGKAESFGDSVRVIEAPDSMTKATGLNRGIEMAASEIVVFADARQRFEKDTIAKLVEPFHDREVGAVSGNLEIEQTGTGAGAGIDFYWKLERFIRYAESRIDSSIGCTGAVYAIRRDAFRPIPEDTILDDVVIPMQIAVRGQRVLFLPEARAFDPQSLAPELEQRRKVRTLAGNWQMMFRYPSWLSPVTNRLWFPLIAHKYLRLLGPVFLAGCLLGSAWLFQEHWIYQLAFGVQAILYSMAAVGLAVPKLPWKAASVSAGFVFLQWQCIRSFFYYLGFRPKDGW